IPAVPSTWTRFAPVTLREAKIRSGISGGRAVRCRAMNAPSRTSEAAARPSVLAASQPCCAAGSTMVNTASIIAAVISSAPGTSMPARRPAPPSPPRTAGYVHAPPQPRAPVPADDPHRADRRDRADGQVDEEDPVPVQHLGED